MRKRFALLLYFEPKFCCLFPFVFFFPAFFSFISLCFPLPSARCPTLLLTSFIAPSSSNVDIPHRAISRHSSLTRPSSVYAGIALPLELSGLFQVHLLLSTACTHLPTLYGYWFALFLFSYTHLSPQSLPSTLFLPTPSFLLSYSLSLPSIWFSIVWRVWIQRL